MDKRIITTIVVVQAFGLSVLGWAAREPRENREPAAVVRMQARDVTAFTHVQGTLDCQHQEANTGDACVLKLTASDSGRIYEIRGSNPAMRLYNDGIRNVSVEGKTRGPYLLVSKIQAIDTLKQ